MIYVLLYSQIAIVLAYFICITFLYRSRNYITYIQIHSSHGTKLGI